MTKLIKDTKAATPTTAPNKGGRAQTFSNEALITLTYKENPKRGASAARFALYSSLNKGEPVTVASYLKGANGVKGVRADLAWDSQREFIKITEPKAK